MKKIGILVIIGTLLCTAMSCTSFSDIYEEKYSASYASLDALIGNSADFDDLSLDDRWAIVWHGMFSSFTEYSGDSANPYRYVLSKKLRVSVTKYDSNYFEYTGERAYYYRVQDKESLQELGDIAIKLLCAQGDIDTAIMWMEDFNSKIKSIEGNYNWYALSPYLKTIDRYAYYIFEMKSINNGLPLSDDSEGAIASKAYLDKYPAGEFIEYAKKRQNVLSGTEAELIL